MAVCAAAVFSSVAWLAGLILVAVAATSDSAKSPEARPPVDLGSVPPLLGVTPEMQNKSVSQLLREVSWTKWFNTSNWTYINRLVELGSDAVPEMIQVLREAPRQPFVRQLRLDPPGQPPNAPLLETVVKALAELLAEQPNVASQTVIDALLKIRPAAALPILTAGLEAAAVDVRLHSALALAAFDDTRPRAFAVLRDLLERWESEARTVPPGTRTYPADDAASGVEPIPGKIPWQVGNVCSFLTRPELHAAEVAPALSRLVASPYRHVAQNAAMALARIGPPAKLAAPALADPLQHDSGLVRVNAALALAKVDRQIEAALKVLVAELKHPVREVRGTAAMHLVELGEDARPALPELRKMLDDPLDLPRVHAAKAVWKLDPQPDEVVPAMISLLEYSIRMTGAMEVLAEIGPPAKAAIPILRKATKTRWSGKANEALAKIDPETLGKKETP